MTVAQERFGEFVDIYNKLVKMIMVVNGIREIQCTSKDEHWFDRMVMNGETLEVYNYGLKEPFRGLGFDFTLDYARCVSYIEDDLFLTERKGTPEHGMIFTFNK